MLEINQSLNLTRWTQDEDVLNQHLLDSANALPLIKSLGHPQGPEKWLDLGTGCGFPGVVLMAAFPQVEVTLLDSVAKKTKALEVCLQASGLKGKILTGRAEEVGREPSSRETWDLVSTRAVADFPVVLEYSLPLLKTGGYLVDWMTEEQLSSVDKSERALKLLDSKILKKADYLLPGLAQKRWLVVVEKLGKTSATYPRPTGKASRKPL